MRLDIFSMRLCMGRGFSRIWLRRPVCACMRGGGGVL